MKVFRVRGEREKGLRILDIPSRKVRVLTTEYDNLPGWSTDGRRIVFTHQTSATNFDVFTIRPVRVWGSRSYEEGLTTP